MTRFIKIGRYYINMERIDIIRHCAGDVIEVVMRDGRLLYGSMIDLKKMEIIERP